MNYGSNKGLTLVEVLVSVVITIIVMMYGMTLFIAAWKLEVDSDEYSKILQYMSNTIEKYKNYANIIDRYGGNGQNITIPDIELPSKKILGQQLIIYNANEFANNTGYGKSPGAIPVTLIATWYSDTAKQKPIDKVIINTYFFCNMESYFKGDISNPANNEFSKI